MQDEIIHLAADIVAAYVSNNPVNADKLPKLISEVYAALAASVSTVTAED